MKLTIKLVPILILILLASPLVLLKGCGTVVNGGACGGCPDSTAPFGSTITASTLDAATMSPTSAACYLASFVVTGPDELPMNDICVELNTNGAMALHTPTSGGQCGSVIMSPQSYIRTRTDGTGTITVDFLVDSPCSTLGLATGASSASFFIQATSCAVSGTSTAEITIAPVCP